VDDESDAVHVVPSGLYPCTSLPVLRNWHLMYDVVVPRLSTEIPRWYLVAFAIEYPAAMANLMFVEDVDRAEDAIVASAEVQVVDGTPELSVHIFALIVFAGSTDVLEQLLVKDFSVYADAEVNEPKPCKTSNASSLPIAPSFDDVAFESVVEQEEPPPTHGLPLTEVALKTHCAHAHRIKISNPIKPFFITHLLSNLVFDNQRAGITVNRRAVIGMVAVTGNPNHKKLSGCHRSFPSC